MQAASTHAGSRVILGCFRVGDVHVALDVTQVREVVRWQPVTPLPHAPALIEGVVDLRGVVVPVVDLGRVLSGRPVEPGGTARIALVGRRVRPGSRMYPARLHYRGRAEWDRTWLAQSLLLRLTRLSYTRFTSTLPDKL